MKILCATDFGSAAGNAARVAAWLARWTGGSLELAHALARPPIEPVALAAEAGLLDREVRESVRGRLSELAAALAKDGALDVQTAILDGAPDDAILRQARLGGADLIVMGAHARSALDRALFGSTAARTVRRATVPVLVVPAGAEAWGPKAKGDRLSIVAALDGGPAGAGPVEILRRLRGNVACDVTALRLYWPPEEYRRLGLTGARSLAAPDRDVVADLEPALRKLVGTLPGAGATTFVVQPAWGEPAWQLLDAAKERKADLVVLGTESRHGLARLTHAPVAEHVARAATEVPVLFVPAPAAAPAANVVPHFGTVLAATDLSPLGNRAVAFAYGLARAGGVVELCYVHERALPSPIYAYERTAGALDEAHRAQIEATLRALVPEDAERQGISTHVTVVDGGRAGEAVVQAAERLHVDAIVLGSHGRGGVARALVGSVAESVMRTARRPVLVVPAPVE
jgi:nucleotide-binding universal stress UspA family protein